MQMIRSFSALAPDVKWFGIGWFLFCCFAVIALVDLRAALRDFGNLDCKENNPPTCTENPELVPLFYLSCVLLSFCIGSCIIGCVLRASERNYDLLSPVLNANNNELIINQGHVELNEIRVNRVNE